MVHNELSLRLGELAGHLSQCTLVTPSGQLGTCRLLAQAAREMSVSHGVCMHTHTHTSSSFCPPPPPRPNYPARCLLSGTCHSSFTAFYRSLALLLTNQITLWCQVMIIRRCGARVRCTPLRPPFFSRIMSSVTTARKRKMRENPGGDGERDGRREKERKRRRWGGMDKEKREATKG